MFLRRLSSDDERFKAIDFHAGLNILVADRTESSEQGDSRNGTGKTSLVRILRYLMGGSLSDELKNKSLEDHRFNGIFGFPVDDDELEVHISRPVKPQTRLQISGWPYLQGDDVHVDEWRAEIGRSLFKLPSEVAAPTPGQLWGQLIRTQFGDPTKSYPTDSGWVTGVKLGYLLGLSPEVLNKAGEVETLRRQRKAIRTAVKEGALGRITLDEANLRAQLANARQQRDRIEAQLRDFRVDEQYADHQRLADSLSARIRRLNDEAIGYDRRQSELREAISTETEAPSSDGETDRLGRMYREVGVVLPDTVTRRYEEVQLFHASVVRNRRRFLEEELRTVGRQLEEVERERSDLDTRRAGIMRLLQNSVALGTFLDAQASLTSAQAAVMDLENRLESASRINQIDTLVTVQSAETVIEVRAELAEHEKDLEAVMAMFSELGGEIYADREAWLRISSSAQGILSVQPNVPGDASEGIRSVETFLLDMVCLITAMKSNRSPRILVHDSHLFDSIDHRQVASCLNIGARLADQYGFQYLVTMNSDFLASVESQSDGAFESAPYELTTRLHDDQEDGGLFGFRFA